MHGDSAAMSRCSYAFRINVVSVHGGCVSMVRVQHFRTKMLLVSGSVLEFLFNA